MNVGLTRFFRGASFIALAILIVFGSAVLAAEAGEDKDTIQKADHTDEVTVTGSLIPRPTLEALSPVTVVGVEEITYSGVSRIEDLMTQLPQAFAGQNSTWANGASGTATVNLRHLGSNRTLVLINGRRMAPGDASSVYSPDLNVVPAALVKRVDVLTGGASSVYGTDAVAGVVNFVMDTEFEGVRGGIQYSFYQHDNNNSLAQAINAERGFDAPSGSITDGDGVAINLAFGGKFGNGKGHASAYVTFRNLEEVTKGARDYLNCSVAAGEDGPYCGGSSTTPRGRFIAYNADGSFNGDYVLDWEGDGHSFRPRTGEVFNYGPFNHIQRPDKQWNAGAFLTYKFSDRLEGYAELMFMNNYTDAQIAPSGNFAVYNKVNCDNPMLSDQQRETLCGEGTGYGPTDYADVYILRRNIEGEPRTNQLGHTNLRLLAGFRGDFNDQWSWDAYGLHAQNDSQDSYINDLSVTRIGNALDVIEDENGDWVCRSGDPGCVPWNIFEQGAVDQAAIDYISTVAVMYGKTSTDVLNFTVNGDLEDYGWAFPGASEGVQVAIGTEYRQEALRNMPDEVYRTANAAGFGGATPQVRGGFNVKEFFVEGLLPLVQDTAGAQDLSLELGYRYSDYNISGGADTYKAQLSWAPTADFKVRGGFNRAIRHANAWELFRAQGFGLGGSRDICAGANPTGTLEECMNTGVTAAQYGHILGNPADQYNTQYGGNPLLTPETADTLTFGVVVTPKGLPGFTATVDYYDIEIDDAIGSLGADDIIQTCATTGDPQLCSLIHRDSAGTLWLTTAGYTETTNQNIGSLKGSGIDLSASYTTQLGEHGFLSADIVGTYMLEDRFTNPLTDYDCVGYFGFQCGQPDAEWRHRARVTWETTFKTTFSLAWRHIGSAKIDDASPDSDIGDPDAMEIWRINDVASVPSYDWFDLSGTYNFSDGIQLTIGINNILDEEPPLFPDLADDGGVNTYGVYDPLGRFVHTSLRFEF